MRVQIHKLGVRIHELRDRIHETRVQIHELQVQIYELQIWIHGLRVQKIIKIQLKSLKSSLFPKISSPKFVRQLVRSVSGDNLLFYASTTAWLRRQQDAEWVNINFERRHLNSPQKSHPSANDFGESFTRN